MEIEELNLPQLSAASFDNPRVLEEVEVEMKCESTGNLVSFVVFGQTGSGKSSFLNTLAGKTIVAESNQTQSKTDKTEGFYGEFECQQFFGIDTPGLQDSEGRDTANLAQMTQYIKSQPTVQAFVIVLNFLNNRIDKTIINLFQLFNQMYPEKKWYHHIAIVWTCYCKGMPENIKETRDIKRKGCLDEIKKKVVPNITEQELSAIPQIFIDNIEAREVGSDSRDQIRGLMAWIAQLEPLNKTLGEIQKADNVVMKEEIQTEIRQVGETIELNILTIETATFERIKKTLFSGDIVYTDWVEKEGTRKKEKKVLYEDKIDVKIEYRERKEIIGERRQVDEMVGKREIGRIIQKIKRTKERRIIKTHNNGDIDELPWEIIQEDDEEVLIGNFGEHQNESESFMETVLREAVAQAAAPQIEKLFNAATNKICEYLK